MAQRSKAYKAAKAAIGEDLYSPVEAIRLAKETNPSKTCLLYTSDAADE